MKHANVGLVFGLAALLLSNWPVAAGTAAGILQSGSHCVAYRTSKTVALVSSEDIIGRNCNVTVRLVASGQDRYTIEVIVPIINFNSSNRDRDQEVAKILKSSTHPNIVFRSQPLSKQQFKQMAQAKMALLSGALLVGGRRFQVQTQASARQVGTGWEVSGLIRSKFTAFGIDPPRIAGGVVAYAADYLELYYNLQSNRVQNAQAIQ